MPASRSELDAALYQLHAALPLWRGMKSGDALFDHYGEKLAELVSEVAPIDRHYAVAQASDLMAAVDARRMRQHHA